MSVVAVKALRDYFDSSQVEALAADEPAWLRTARLAGWKAWQDGIASQEALSTRSGGRWLAEARVAPNWNLDPGAKLMVPQVLEPSLTDSAWGTLNACRVYTQDSEKASALGAEAAAAGVIFCSLKQAIREHEAIVKAHLFSRTSVDETSYAGLNAAFFQYGAFLYVPKGARLTLPLRNSGVHVGGVAGFFPRTLIVVEDDAEVTFIDEIHSAGAAPGLCAMVSELVLGQNARLNYINSQLLNAASGSVSRQTTVLGQDAKLYTLSVIVGGAWSTSSIASRLEGAGANVDLLGLLLGQGEQKTEIRTLQDHVGRAGNSDALVKTILRDKARAYFDGVVRIFKSGQNSNAFQSNPNLLLSSDARAESVPTLEIEADDVACKHAASIGSIDEDEKFYLLSRGISPRDTESMIVEGFAAELAQRLPNEGLQERFIAILNQLAMRA